MLKKYKLILVAVTLLVAVSTIHVFAGDYTNSDPNTNNWYNRYNAVSYAIQYAVNPNTQKYSFYSNGDCTNFASQVLHEGNMSMTGMYNASSINSWYYNSYYIRSDSWINAHKFRYHWGNVNDVGYNGSYAYRVMTYSEAYNDFVNKVYTPLWEADVIGWVAASNGETTHMSVVQDYNTDTKDIIICQHSSPVNINVSLKSTLKKYIDAGGGSNWLTLFLIKKGP